MAVGGSTGTASCGKVCPSAPGVATRSDGTLTRAVTTSGGAATMPDPASLFRVTAVAEAAPPVSSRATER